MTSFFTQRVSAPLALNRRESLLAYLTTPNPQPVALSRAEHDALSPLERAEYDEGRVRFLSGGVVVNTPAVAACLKSLKAALRLNAARNSGHAGVMLTGNSTMGKTTTAKEVLRWVMTQYAQAFPDWADEDHIPVAYIEVPSGANAKDLMKEFAHFLGLSVLARETASDIRTKVVAAFRRANTQLIVVDELHNLDGHRAGLGEASDVLKGLSNDLTTTFIYAGLDLTTSKLMAGTRGQQLTSRFTAVELTRYDWNLKEDRTRWRGLVRAFEKKSTLLDQQPGTLEHLTEYLWARTGGGIGALSRLLTGTAIDLIADSTGSEVFSEAAFDEYPLDYTSELLYARKSTPNVKARGTTAKKRQPNPNPSSPALDAAKAAVLEASADR